MFVSDARRYGGGGGEWNSPWRYEQMAIVSRKIIIDAKERARREEVVGTSSAFLFKPMRTLQNPKRMQTKATP